MKFVGNFKVIAAIVAVFVFMLILYGYNRKERRTIANNMTNNTAAQPLHNPQQQAFNAYTRPNLGPAKKGCGCGAKK